TNPTANTSSRPKSPSFARSSSPSSRSSRRSGACAHGSPLPSGGVGGGRLRRLRRRRPPPNLPRWGRDQSPHPLTECHWASAPLVRGLHVIKPLAKLPPRHGLAVQGQEPLAFPTQ